MKGLLLFGLAFGAPPERPRDAWFGRDKVKHFLVSAFAQSVGYAGLQAAGVDRSAALAGATVLTATVAIGKEVVDRRGGGAFSRRDLAWDAAGAAAATVLLRRTER